jgi:hypothetical protein
MATLQLKASNFCAADNHFTLSATGDITFSTNYVVDGFLAPLTDEEKAIFLKALVRFAKIGRTAAQVKTALINGVTVTI